MSRSGYSDCLSNQELNIWRGAVKSAIRGKKGQAFLREMAAALDAMPAKELVPEVIVQDGAACAIGAVALARRLDVADLDVTDQEAIAKRFGIAQALAAEIAYQNDERGGTWVPGELRDGQWVTTGHFHHETPAERWTRMRAWVNAETKR